MSTNVASVGATDPYAALASSNAAPATANQSDAADRFLKLLVTQLQNQDPLNPMDNAQITSQMAQINTVNGIEKLNTTVQGLSGSFVQMQALQGASLVGRDVTLSGNRIAPQNGVGVGGFDLAGTADTVTVDILSPAGQVVKTLDLGTQEGGRHGFTWDATGVPDGMAYSFRVNAKAGTTAVTSQPLMRDHVDAVSTIGNRLVLETTNSGYVAYADVQAVN
ncbi:MAG: flagellar hook assembly protein FlgD [Pseudomonadota bacterium]|nr:flagellar hook assembly protein FlgD [Pseudomonadota bacterium]